MDIQQPLPKEETKGSEKKSPNPPLTLEHPKPEIKENKKSPTTDVPKTTTKRNSTKKIKNVALIPIPPPSEDEVLARRQRRANQRNDLYQKSLNENNLNDLFYLVVWDLMGNEYCWPFYYPVDPQALGINDYLEKIKNPMDLSTVKEKILNNQYPNTTTFCNDVRLVFQNAMDYNAPESDISNSANGLLQIFEKMAKKLMDIENKSKLQLKIELEGKVKDHSEIVNNLKKEEIVLQEQKKKVDEENNIPGPRALSKISSLPPLDYNQKKKIYDIFTNFPDKYKRGLTKIIENDMKDKERIKRATKENEDEIQIEIDAFDKITMRRIEAYVKECCERENIPFNIANSSLKDSNNGISPEKTLETSDNKIPSPNVKEPTTPMKDEKKQEVKENIPVGEKTGENKEEESSSSSSEVSSNDSSDSDSSEDSENGAGNLIIDQQNNNNANKGQVKT